MNRNRIFEIMQGKEIKDIYYDEKPIWIQEVNNDVAKIGFMDGAKEKNVYIEDLYEKDLYSN